MNDRCKLVRRRVVAAMSALALGAIAGLAQADGAIEASGVVQADHPGPVLDRHVFGQFAEHLGNGVYGGVWVGETSSIPNTHGYRNDVVAALREIRTPVIRWPGGCFADEYNWRDGIGPRGKRPVQVNTNWGGVEETNAFGTNEYMDFAELVGADAYISGDIGSEPPRDMANWVEYITSPSRSTLADARRANGRDQPWKLPYFGVGNEVWGCGGNMRAEYAADNYRRYQTFVKEPAGDHFMKIASGPNGDDDAWTDTMMKIAGPMMDGLSLHYYTVPTGVWEHKGSSTDFGEDQYISTIQRALKMDELLTKHSAIMDKYDPAKRVALVVDEWGVWTDPDPGTNPGFLRQQNSLRDALIAAATLDIFADHADRVRMANIAQMVNVLQAMILTDGPRMVLTPTYYVYDMDKAFQGGRVLPVSLRSPRYTADGMDVPALRAAAVQGDDGVVHLSLVNFDPAHGAKVSLTLEGVAGRTIASRTVSGQVLTAPKVSSVNTFAAPGTVVPVAFHGARADRGVLVIDAPPKSAVVLDIR